MLHFSKKSSILKSFLLPRLDFDIQNIPFAFELYSSKILASVTKFLTFCTSANNDDGVFFIKV